MTRTLLLLALATFTLAACAQRVEPVAPDGALRDTTSY